MPNSDPPAAGVRSERAVVPATPCCAGPLASRPARFRPFVGGGMLLAAAVMLLACGRHVSMAATDPELEALEERAFVQAAALVGPSVVRIQTFGGADRVGQMLAPTGPTTGVVVGRDGYIISSAFNFASKPASILVELTDGRRFAAEVVATDRLKMLTLLRIDADDLQPVEAAPMESIRVGQWAIALGRTYDQPVPSFSVGVVSAIGRVWGKAIQTDAKISPVNYGGPLVDISGRVMGVLSPLSPSAESESAGVEWYDSGIGFAIPMEDIYASLDRLKSGADLSAGLLGIALASSRQLDAKPAIDRVRIGSPAEEAGLKSGDLIVKIDGQDVKRQADVKQTMGNKYAGESVLLVVRRGEETIERELTLVAELLPYESGFLGILPERASLDANSDGGIAVRYVYPGGPADKAGIRAGDRIIRFGENAVTDAPSLTDLVSRMRPGETGTVTFDRDGRSQTIQVQLASIPADVPQDLPTSAVPPGQPVAKADDDGDAPLKTGRFSFDLPNHQDRCWAYVPDDYNPQYAYGLAVWIHPDGDTMEAAIFKHWRTICDRRGILLLAPKASDQQKWTLNDAEFVNEAVQQFAERYAVDAQRIFVHGYAQSGTFAYHLAFKYRAQFRGLAVVADPLRFAPPENDPNYRLQLHLVCDKDDPVYKPVEATVKGLRELRYPVSFTEVSQQGRQYPPEPVIDLLGRWADCLDRI